MGIFKDMLSGGETLFRDSVALDYDYLPKIIPFRENEQARIASCIKPLFQSRNGRNLFIFGSPGVGKTAACKHVLNEIEETTEDIYPLYINCWKHNTSYKVILKICEDLGYKFTQNKKTEELFNIVRDIINKHSAVFVFDEADKAEDDDFLYSILEEVYRKSVILITNDKDYLAVLDSRIRSRLIPEVLEFRKYSLEEVREILKQRRDIAFYPDVWKQDAFEVVVRKTYETGDIRAGLYLMREAGSCAEDEGKRQIGVESVRSAVNKLDEFYVKDKKELGEDEQLILEIVRENSGKKIGELYKEYVERGGRYTYKTFQRRIDRLEQGKFVNLEKISGGKEGKTTIVKDSSDAKLTEF
ncbi:MAG: AAA family ATPase [Candidatus Woesearchaeota archaeon]